MTEYVLSSSEDENEEQWMSTDGKQVENTLKSLDETWSKVRPGTRICGFDREGNPCVFLCEDLTTPIGCFDSEAEAKAFACAPLDIERLQNLVKKLLKDRNEALAALRAISQVADPALEDFEEQRPVDMAAVLKTTHHWSHYILSQ